MCEICDLKSEDPAKRTAMRDGLLMNAERLDRIADSYRRLAHRELHPHSPEIKPVVASVYVAIRMLVEDWL